MSVMHFLQYHNSVPIAVSFLILGAGGVFAATNPEAIYSADESVVSIDNTYLVGKDLASYTPRVQITGITEDESDYYVAYTFSTIDLHDYVWKDIDKAETLKVSKADLGQYGDLGLFVTAQMKQLIDSEVVRLKQTQEIEKRLVSQKMVATAYSGLLGAMFDDRTEVIPGYVPVVAPPAPVQTSSEPAQSGGQASGETQQPQSSIAVQILGKNPARIPIGATYADLGAFAQGSDGQPLIFDTYLNGARVNGVGIDTSATSTWTIRYEARDAGGGTAYAERTVVVYDPNDPSSVVEEPVVQEERPREVIGVPVPPEEQPQPVQTPAPSPEPEDSGDVPEAVLETPDEPADSPAATSTPEQSPETPAE